jgi:hypothetical protein
MNSEFLKIKFIVDRFRSQIFQCQQQHIRNVGHIFMSNFHSWHSLMPQHFWSREGISLRASKKLLNVSFITLYSSPKTTTFLHVLAAVLQASIPRRLNAQQQNKSKYRKNTEKKHFSAFCFLDFFSFQVN